MKRILWLFAAAALLCACGGRGGDRTVDVAAAAPADLEEVAAGWELLPLDESETPLGSVSMVKRYGDKTFVGCRRDHRIFMYEGTTLAGVLSAYGRGPGEYMDMEDFAFREATSELLVNDRRLPGFRIYKVPEMTWVRDEKHDFQVGNFETVDATHSLFSLEPDEEDVAGGGQVQVWDHQAGAPSDQ